MGAPRATPLLLLSELGEEIEQGSDITTSTRHRRLIVEASDRLQKWCNRRFDEYIATLYHSARPLRKGGDVDGVELILDGDLKSLTTLTNGDGTTITSSEYQLLPRNSAVKRRIRLDPTGSTSWTYDDDPVGSISVLGTWGYGGQWMNTGTTVNNAGSAQIGLSDTTFTSSAGASLEAGMVLKIDSEYLYVDSVSTNTITVVRAYNGSTAATHAHASVVYRWETEPAVAAIVKFLVIWHIERMQSRLGQQTTIGLNGLPTVLSSAPVEVRDGIRDAGLKRQKRIWTV